MASNGKGQFALVWQGFRGKNCNIFLKTFDGEKWSADIRITSRAANDWEPSVAIDGKGGMVAYDSYKNGNYDVLVTPVSDGEVGAEMAVAATPRFEARPAIASGYLQIACGSPGKRARRTGGKTMATRSVPRQPRRACR